MHSGPGCSLGNRKPDRIYANLSGAIDDFSCGPTSKHGLKNTAFHRRLEAAGEFNAAPVYRSRRAVMKSGRLKPAKSNASKGYVMESRRLGMIVRHMNPAPSRRFSARLLL